MKIFEQQKVICKEKLNIEDIMRDTRGLSFFISENKKWFAS